MGIQKSRPVFFRSPQESVVRYLQGEIGVLRVDRTKELSSIFYMVWSRTYGVKNENSTSQCVVACGSLLLAFKGASTRYMWLFPSESSSSRWQRQQHRDMHQEGTAGHVPPLKSGVAWAQVPRYQEDLDVETQPADCWLFFHFLMLHWQAPF